MTATSGTFKSGRFRAAFVFAILWVVAFDVAFFWQRISGAHSSEFGGHPEESAHYLAGLMIHDYIADGFPGKVTEFAGNYRAHYPSLSLGESPVFHIAEGTWMFPFGIGRTSVMLLLCALAATMATVLFGVLREEFGPALAITGSVILVSLPLVREYYSLVMPGTLTAVLMFAAAIVLGRYLDEERAEHAIWFGVLAGLATLTETTALSHLLVIPIATVLARKVHLFARPALWGGLALAALIGGPWTWHFRALGAAKGAAMESKGEAILSYLGDLGFALGVVLSALFCFGLILRLINPGLRRGRWAALASLVAAVFVSAIIVPGPREVAHLLPAVPAALMFIVAGAVGVQALVAKRWQQAGSAGPAFAIIFLIFAFATVETSARLLTLAPSKHWSGFGKMADEILNEDPSGRLSIMVSSDPIGEGAFIAELAMREKRPGHRVRSASKELSRADARGHAIRPRFRSEDEVADWFAKAGIDYLLIDESLPDEDRGEFHDQLIRTVDSHTERFWPMTKSTISREGQMIPGPITLYRVKHVE